MSWATTLPTAATNAAQTPSIYQGNWEAIDQFIDTEHYSFTSTNSGSHLLGETGVMMEGTTAAITAISTAPGSGALAFDTTEGAWVYNGAGDDEAWKPMHLFFPTTRVRAWAEDYSPVSGDTTVIPFVIEELDSLSEFSITTSVFSAKDVGCYYVQGNILVNTSTSGGGDDITLLLSGSAGIYRSSTKTTMTSAYTSMGISTIARVASGGTLAFCIAAPSNKTTDVSGGAGHSFLRIHRVS